MNAVGIVGLGLIGGSFAKAIKKHLNINIFAFDMDESVTQKALDEGVAHKVLTSETLHQCDVVIIALYPKDVIDYVKGNIQSFKKGALIVDAAGVKEQVCMELSPLCKSQGVNFIGGHPMAGIEKSGYDNCYADLFCGASMILCKEADTDLPSLHRAEEFFLSIGFGSIKISTAAEHDRVIAYTSQLAHVVSNAYVKSETLTKRMGFSAGSYKDLTRVARLNPRMWAELFIDNRDNLIYEIDYLVAELQKYRDAISAGNMAETVALLEVGTKLKIADDRGEHEWKQ